MVYAMSTLIDILYNLLSKTVLYALKFGCANSNINIYLLRANYV